MATTHDITQFLRRSLRFRGTAGSRLSSPYRHREEQSEHASWSSESGVESCQQCGRTILLGEESARLRDGERIVVVCSTCTDRLIAGGLQRAA